MAKWIGQWIVQAAVFAVGAGLVFVLWAIWPMLPDRLPVEIVSSMSVEGMIAIGTLLAVSLGFGRLVFAK